MIRAGLLRERVTLQRRADTPDGGGGVTAAWQDVATLWARVQPEKGSEILKADRLQNPQRYIVTLRWRADVTPEMRLLWAGRVFEIYSVANVDERRSGLQLVCE